MLEFKIVERHFKNAFQLHYRQFPEISGQAVKLLTANC